MTTYLACIGSRTEIIAMAALHRVLRARGDRLLVLHAGPHKATADLLYRFFDMGPFLPWPLSLPWPCDGSAPDSSTAEAVSLVAAAIDGAGVDVLLVQGDSRPAWVLTLAADRLGLPVAHIDAGGHGPPSPTTSQAQAAHHRAAIARLARWHFAATDRLRERLLCVGAAPARVHLVGNPVIDTALWVRSHIASPGFDIANALPLALRRFLRAHPASRLLLLTTERLGACRTWCADTDDRPPPGPLSPDSPPAMAHPHRLAEDWREPVRPLAQAVYQLLQQQPDLIVVWPVRADPVLRGEMAHVLDRLSTVCRDRLCLTEPLDYPALIAVLAQCHITLTDGGGVGQEASALARPVLMAGDGGNAGEAGQGEGGGTGAGRWRPLGGV